MVCDDNSKTPLDKLSELNWPDKLSNFVRPVIKFVIYLSIGLLALSWLSVALVPYIRGMMSVILGIESIPDADLLNSATSIILISITGAYVLLTHDLVKENQKTAEQNKIDRKIAHIEKKLEYFYYPLHKRLYPPHTITVGDVIDAIYPYQYLATENTKKIFTDHLVAETCTDRGAVLEKLAIFKDLREAVDSDIASLQKELNDLIG